MPSDKYPGALFSYTSGRFLFNEDLRLKEREVYFNVAELRTAVHRTLGHAHGRVTQMSKLAEGGFNRVFLLQMEDGFELIAKVPCRIVGPAFYATASEAATLAFLKAKGVPVPEVYAYCPNQDNPVRSEYILLEKAAGVSVASRWADMSDDDIGRLTRSLVELENSLFALSFGAIGSLYSKKDLLRQHQMPLGDAGILSEGLDEFCIGPIVDYMFWYGEKSSYELDRGPWTDQVQYLEAIARK